MLKNLNTTLKQTDTQSLEVYGSLFYTFRVESTEKPSVCWQRRRLFLASTRRFLSFNSSTWSLFKSSISCLVSLTLLWMAWSFFNPFLALKYGHWPLDCCLPLRAYFSAFGPKLNFPEMLKLNLKTLKLNLKMLKLNLKPQKLPNTVNFTPISKNLFWNLVNIAS